MHDPCGQRSESAPPLSARDSSRSPTQRTIRRETGHGHAQALSRSHLFRFHFGPGQRSATASPVLVRHAYPPWNFRGLNLHQAIFSLSERLRIT